MSLPQFNELISLSHEQLKNEIIKLKNEIFNLIFQKATKQPFKSHLLKYKQHRLAQLKTLLTKRVKEKGKKT